MASPTGKDLNRRYRVHAKTGRYRETGDWYAPIRNFPATLWDAKGYLRFEMERDLERYAQFGLNIHPSGQITAPKESGIAAMPGYIRVLY
jgi:hypothetical protein